MIRPVLAAFALSAALPVLAAPSRPITLARAEGKDPNGAAAAIASAWNGKTVAVFVSDKRTGTDPAIVGKQQLKDKLLYEWKAAQPVPDAVRAMAEQTLKSWNVTIAADAPARIDLEIRTLYVDEVPATFGSTYRGEVELRGTVFDPDAVRHAPRTVRGVGKRSGPDRRAKLCNEALTLALEDSLAQLLAPPAAKPEVEPESVAAAAEPPHVGPASAEEMLKDLVRLKDEGLGEQVMLRYVRQRQLTAPLSVDDILTWKAKGVPESVIQAAQEAR